MSKRSKKKNKSRLMAMVGKEAAGKSSSNWTIDKGHIERVIERWRSSTMSHRAIVEEEPPAVVEPIAKEPPPLGPSPDSQRFKTLRKPLGSSGASFR